MIVAHLSDLHVTASRLELHKALLKACVGSVGMHAPDVILVTGDLAGTVVPHRASPSERNALLEFFVALAELAPVLVLRGNHDFPGDYSFLNAVASKHSIVFVDQPELVTLETKAGLALVVALPWLDRSQFPMKASWADGLTKQYLDTAKGAVAELDALRKEDRRSIAIAAIHGAIIGGSIRPGQPSIATSDPQFDARALGDLDVCAAAFVGHYHAFHKVPIAFPCFYAGSLFNHEYGESTEKGWVRWDSEYPAHATLVQYAEQLPRVTVRLDCDAESVVSVEPDIIRLASRPARVDLKIVATAGGTSEPEIRRMVSDLQARFGTSLVGPPRVEIRRTPTVRARAGAVEVSKAPTLRQKVEAYWDSIDPPPTDATRARALEILDELGSAP